MIVIATLIRLQIKLMTKGDRMLYFYLISIISFKILNYHSFTLLWQIFLAISNLYLVLLYSRDADLKVFYKILNISKFKIHTAKICIIYLLSLLQIVLLVQFSNEPDRAIIFIVHFLSFYTSIILYKLSDLLKLIVLIGSFAIISLILYIFPLAPCTILIFVIVTLIIIREQNEPSERRKANLV